MITDSGVCCAFNLNLALKQSTYSKLVAEMQVAVACIYYLVFSQVSCVQYLNFLRQRQELIHWMKSNKGKQLQDQHIAVQYFFDVWVVKYSTGWGPPFRGCELRWKVLRTGKTN